MFHVHSLTIVNTAFLTFCISIGQLKQTSSQSHQKNFSQSVSQSVKQDQTRTTKS